jgi:hypothetical protein
MAKKRLRRVTLLQAINALKALIEWAAYMGDWEAPCWKHARSFVSRWRDELMEGLPVAGVLDGATVYTEFRAINDKTGPGTYNGPIWRRGKEFFILFNNIKILVFYNGTTGNWEPIPKEELIRG